MPIPFKNFFRNPRWIRKEYLQVEKFNDFPSEYIAEVRKNLHAAVSDQPEVSILLCAYNEEANLVRCLDSLSKSKTSYPFEVVMVNNNSTDNTIAAIRALDLPYYNQTIQGAGPSRQMAIDHARGKYILLADTDCVYPPGWIQKMVDLLRTDGTAVVYGRHSFMAEGNSGGRWKLAIYEFIRDLNAEIKHLKRPFLNAYGMSMAFHRENAIKEGFIGDNRRGFDGRICFDLMKYGKVKCLRSTSANTWTSTRALQRDGSFFKAVITRLMKHLSHLDEYFRPMPDHDTKSSTNPDGSLQGSLHRIKKKARLSSTSH